MSASVEELKKVVAEFINLKDEIKKATERKNLLEKKIVQEMQQLEVSAIELPNGSSLSCKVKESITVKKKE